MTAQPAHYPRNHPVVQIMFAAEAAVMAGRGLTVLSPEVDEALGMVQIVIQSIRSGSADELEPEILQSMRDQVRASARVITAHAEGQRLTKALMQSTANMAGK